MDMKERTECSERGDVSPEKLARESPVRADRGEAPLALRLRGLAPAILVS